VMSDFDITETLSFPCLTTRLTFHEAAPSLTFYGVTPNPVKYTPVMFNPWPEHTRPWARSWFNPLLWFIHLPFPDYAHDDPEYLVLFCHEEEGHGDSLLLDTPAKQLMRLLAWEIYTEIYHLAFGDLGEIHLPQMENIPNIRTYHPRLQKIYNAIAPAEELLAIYGGIAALRLNRNPIRISHELIQETKEAYILDWYSCFKNFPNVSALIPSSEEALSFYLDLEDLLNKLIFPYVYHSEGWPHAPNQDSSDLKKDNPNGLENSRMLLKILLI
jgi:hypothetical protein